MSETEKVAVSTELLEQQKAKAVEYLRMLGIFKPYIQGFKQSDKVCFFEQFGGFWVCQEPEIEKKMREIEQEHDCKVYAITHEKVYGDDMWSFLVVTSNPQEWADLVGRSGNGFYAFAYTWNRSYDYGSEFGDIFLQSFGGGIRRIG